MHPSLAILAETLRNLIPLGQSKPNTASKGIETTNWQPARRQNRQGWNAKRRGRYPLR